VDEEAGSVFVGTGLPLVSDLRLSSVRRRSLETGGKPDRAHAVHEGRRSLGISQESDSDRGAARFRSRDPAVTCGGPGRPERGCPAFGVAGAVFPHSGGAAARSDGDGAAERSRALCRLRRRCEDEGRVGRGGRKSSDGRLLRRSEARGATPVRRGDGPPAEEKDGEVLRHALAHALARLRSSAVPEPG